MRMTAAGSGIRREIIERLREHSSDCGDWGTCGGVKEKGRVRLWLDFQLVMTSWIMPIMHVFRENNKISLVWNYLGGREICGLRSETLAKDTDVKVCRAQKTVRLEWGLEGEQGGSGESCRYLNGELKNESAKGNRRVFQKTGERQGHQDTVR